MAFNRPEPKKAKFIEEEFPEDLYGLLFHYNHYQDNWCCFSRDEKREYFNGGTKEVGKGRTVTDAFIDYKKKTDE
tara:strand:+ start:273 stop:497 length:225 start_codon:yes stop_codon:yes gene_type:complete